MTSADPGAPACDAVRTELDAWLDGALDARHHARLDAHVARCGDCAAAVAHGRAYRAAMQRAARSTPAPASLRARVQALIPGEGGSSSA